MDCNEILRNMLNLNEVLVSWGTLTKKLDESLITKQHAMLCNLVLLLSIYTVYKLLVKVIFKLFLCFMPSIKG